MQSPIESEPAKSVAPALRYRSEIDGLRAIAVLVVVIFHAKLGLHGGYVGVDVFFVISGFLITSLIFRDIDTTGFRAIDFWERRVRRIAPAFVVTTLGTIAGAWFLYLPNDFDRVGRAVIAQTFFVSNVYHWRLTGYWGPEAETLPLLHTWSLAVEEQFYIIFPIILVMIAVWRRSWLSPAVISGFVLSLALGIWVTKKNPPMAFYLLPPRAWELLLGSLLARYPFFGQTLPKWLKEVICVAGLATIAISVALFDDRTPFPGVAALVPCLGATAFIWANRSHLTLGGKVLSWKPLVFIGMVSYSFYLLHWPILVYSFYSLGDDLSWQQRWTLVGLIFLASVLSWAVVETPIRKKWLLGDRWRLFSAAAISMVLLLGCGFLITWNRGFPSRFDERTLKFANARDEYGYREEVDVAHAKSGQFPTFGAPDGQVRCLVWGDSHAMSIMPAIDAACRERGIKGIQATHSATAPLLDFSYKAGASLNEKSPEFSEAVAQYAIDHKVGTVVMTGIWAAYQEDPRFEGSLAKTIERLTSAGLKVVIVRDVPTQSTDVPRLLARASSFGLDTRPLGTTLELHREKNKKVDEVLQKFAGPDVQVLDPTPYYVDANGLCPAEYDGVAMYWDSHHLTTSGAMRLVPMFQKIFTEER